MSFRKLLKNGQITLPKGIQEELKLKEGEYLYIYKFQDSIIIVKNHDNNTLNQCIYRSGKISIPVELRKLTGITVDTLLKVQINNSKDKVYITPEKEF